MYFLICVNEQMIKIKNNNSKKGYENNIRWKNIFLYFYLLTLL